MAPAASMQQDSPEIELHARSRRRGPLWRLRRPSSARGIHVLAPFWACEARLAQPPHGAQLLISLAYPHNHGQLGLEPRHFSCSYRTDFALVASFCCFLCVYPQGGPGQLRRPEIAERGAPCPFRCFPRWQGRLAGRGEPRERGRTGGRPPCARSPPPTAPPPPNPKSRVESHGAGDQGGVRHAPPAFSGAYSQGTDEGRRWEGRGIRTRARTRPQRQGMRRGGWGGPIR